MNLNFRESFKDLIIAKFGNAVMIALVIAVSPVVSQGEPVIVQEIEKAHAEQIWDGHSAIEANLLLFFGGKKQVDGKMIMATSAGKSRFEFKDGTLLVFDGSNAWVAPPSAQSNMARFHVLTWPYFLAASFKFDDPGVHVETLGKKNLLGKECETAKITFESGIGDTPDDWYLIYQDPDSKMLKAMAYIATYGTSKSEAESEPHIIVYDKFQSINGVSIATEWKFYNWSKEQGISGELLGEGRLSNLTFVQPTPGVFSKPDNAVESKMPGLEK